MQHAAPAPVLRTVHHYITRYPKSSLRLTVDNGLPHTASLVQRAMASFEPPKPPVPPFSYEDAVKKVRIAENAWNLRDPSKVKMAYTAGTKWRNRSQFLTGRDEVEQFLSGKWEKEQDYRLIKEYWAHTDDRIAVRFVYEYQTEGQWFRAYGNENWQFDANGYMAHRHASINDVPIEESERKFHWDRSGVRPDDHPGLTELGL